MPPSTAPRSDSDSQARKPDKPIHALQRKQQSQSSYAHESFSGELPLQMQTHRKAKGLSEALQSLHRALAPRSPCRVKVFLLLKQRDGLQLRPSPGNKSLRPGGALEREAWQAPGKRRKACRRILRVALLGVCDPLQSLRTARLQRLLPYMTRSHPAAWSNISCQTGPMRLLL